MNNDLKKEENVESIISCVTWYLLRWIIKEMQLNMPWTIVIKIETMLKWNESDKC